MTPRSASETLALDSVVVRAPGTRSPPAPTPILDVPEFRVAPGELVAVLGPNGAGKTTLLHVAALLSPPHSGSIRLLGETATRANAARLRGAVAIVFQDPVLFAGSVLDNAALGLRLRGVPRREAASRATVWLERFGIGDLARRSRRGLSGGEGQRAALARAFAAGPRLLLLDEPFAALDPATRTQLLPELRQRLREGMTAAILVTHDPGEALAFGDRLVVLRAGRIAQSDRPADLVARPHDAVVARLMGCAGTIRGRARWADDGWVLSLPDGPLLAAGSAAPSVQPGGEAMAVVRTGSVVLVPEPAAVSTGWNALRARASSIEITQMGWRIVLTTLAGHDLTAQVEWNHGPPPEVGGRVIATFPPGSVHLVTPDDGACT